MPEPLNIAVFIAGIITAAIKTTTVLSNLHGAPEHIAYLAVEIYNVQLVFKTLQRLIDKPQSLPRRRAAMIQLEDVPVVLTETVLMFSELKTIVTPLAVRRRSPLRMLTWTWQRSTTISFRDTKRPLRWFLQSLHGQ